MANVNLWSNIWHKENLNTITNAMRYRKLVKYPHSVFPPRKHNDELAVNFLYF